MRKPLSETTGSGTSGRAMRGKQRADALFLAAAWPDLAIVQQPAAQLRWELNVSHAYCRWIVATLSRQLTQSYGKGFTKSAVNRIGSFAEAFPDKRIVYALHAQLSDGAYCRRIPATLSQELILGYNRGRWGAEV